MLSYIFYVEFGMKNMHYCVSGLAAGGPGAVLDPLPIEAHHVDEQPARNIRKSSRIRGKAPEAALGVAPGHEDEPPAEPAHAEPAEADVVDVPQPEPAPNPEPAAEALPPLPVLPAGPDVAEDAAFVVPEPPRKKRYINGVKCVDICSFYVYIYKFDIMIIFTIFTFILVC